MKLIQLDKMSGAVADLQPSFERLPKTNHKDGEFRLRRYSRIVLRTSFWNAEEKAEVERLATKTFTQSEELNAHQGGALRDFEQIENSALQTVGFKEAALAYKKCFNLIDGQEVEVHQMRVITKDLITHVAPEGVHQDGYKCIGMLGVNRYNITGGELLVYELDNKEVPFVKYEIGIGDLWMMDDSKYRHNATPIEAVDKDKLGSWDAFVFCAEKTKL